jgi:hypothetical protein
MVVLLLLALLPLPLVLLVLLVLLLLVLCPLLRLLPCCPSFLFALRRLLLLLSSVLAASCWRLLVRRYVVIRLLLSLLPVPRFACRCCRCCSLPLSLLLLPLLLLLLLLLPPLPLLPLLLLCCCCWRCCCDLCSFVGGDWPCSSSSLLTPPPPHEHCVLLLLLLELGRRVPELSVYVPHTCPPASSGCPALPLVEEAWFDPPAFAGVGLSQCASYHRCFNSKSAKLARWHGGRAPCIRRFDSAVSPDGIPGART